VTPDFVPFSATLAAHPAVAMAMVFAGGVMTSLTPCLYPMITAIVTGIIG
jgi:thiol:disulfide interchange protein